MDMYQKRKIRAENKKNNSQESFQKSTFRGINRLMENFLWSLINKDF